MQIKEFIDEKKLKQSLHRRVAQIKKRNASAVKDVERKLDKIKFYCKNGFELTWDRAIKNLADYLEDDVPEYLGMKASEILHIASLLEFSSIVTLDDLNCSNTVVTLLLSKLPLYSVSVGGKQLL